jgi:hypothetical protein
MATRRLGYGSFSLGFACGLCLFYAVPLRPKWAIRSVDQIQRSSSAAVAIVCTPAAPLHIDLERPKSEPLAEQDLLNGAPSVTFGSTVFKRYIGLRRKICPLTVPFHGGRGTT